MFTGIVEQTARVVELRGGAGGGAARLLVELERAYSDLDVGGSVAIDGCCLTAIEIDGRRVAFDLHPETLARTAFGARLRPGARVNVERPLAASGRLDGHFVQGHVDGVGRIAASRALGEGAELTVELPSGLTRYVVEKGSIAIDGVSLTCARVAGARVDIAVVPHTLRATNLAEASEGRPVNVEVDILAKYVERLASSPR